MRELLDWANRDGNSTLNMGNSHWLKLWTESKEENELRARVTNKKKQCGQLPYSASATRDHIPLTCEPNQHSVSCFSLVFISRQREKN